MAVIYVTTNLINNKKYIGADKNNNPKYLGSGLKIKLAIKKYGIENFKKEIIEECDLNDLYIREKYWIDYHNAVISNEFYNISDGGKGGNKLNNPNSLEKWKKNKHNLIQYNKLRKNKSYEEIYGEKAKIEKEKRKLALLNHKVTLSTKRKMSDAHKNKTPWNKGLTKQSDIRVIKNYSNKHRPLFLKKYVILTPDNNIYEFNGKKELHFFIKKINLKLGRKMKINVDKLISNGNEKNYSLIKK